MKEANAEGSDEPGKAANVHQQCLKENEIALGVQPSLHVWSSFLFWTSHLRQPEYSNTYLKSRIGLSNLFVTWLMSCLSGI